MLSKLPQRRHVRQFFVLVVLLLIVGVLGFLSPRPELWGNSPRVSAPQSGAGMRGMNSQFEVDEEEPGGMLEYWQHRLTYPTGNYDPAWLLAGGRQDQQVQRRVPAGRITYSRLDNPSPLSLDPTRWTPIGPQPELEGIYGANSGRINAIAIDPVAPNIAYLGVAGGGIWKSINCCSVTTTWAAVADDLTLPTTAIGDLTIDPNNHNVIYAATGDNTYGYTYSGAGILRSTDAGVTWSALPDSPISQYRASSKLRVDPRNSNNIVLGTKNGAFLSNDAGTTWTSSCLPDLYPQQGQDVTGLVLKPNGGQTDLYLAIGTVFSNGVLSNTLNGANGIYKATVPASGCPTDWTLVSRPDNGWPAGTGSGIPGSQGGNRLGRIDIEVAPSNNDYIYAQVHNPSTQRQLGLWRTTDAGVTWEQRSSESVLRDCFGQSGDFPQNWFNQGLAIDPNNPNTVFMNTVDVWRSNDGGTTFTDLTCSYSGGFVHPDQHALAFKPGSSSTLLLGNDGGAFLTENANDPTPLWSELNDTLNTIEFYGGDISANFAYSESPGAMGGAQDNSTSANVWYSPATPGPASWQLTLGGDGMYSQIEPVYGERWYQEYQYGRLRVSQGGPFGFPEYAEGGWFTAGERLSPIFPYQLYKNSCPPTGCTHLIAGSHRVYETIEGAIPATSWYINSTDLTKNLGRPSFINSVQYSIPLSTTAIVGTNDGNVQYGFGLGQGTLLSATWVNVTGNNQVLPNRPIADVTTDPQDALVGYVAMGGFDTNTPNTPGHVFQVTCSAGCGSYTWVNKTGNLPDLPLNTIIANPRYPQQVFVGSTIGLYYTDDINAASPAWYRFNAGLPTAQVSDLAIDAGFTTLSAWTRSRGAYVWPLPSAPIGATATPTSNVVATSTSTPTATLPIPTSTATVPPSCTLSFTDVPENHTFYEFIRCLACRGIVSGYSDGTFRPGNDVTRGQLSKIVANAAGYNEPVSGQTFTDVPPAHTFYQFIERMAARGIIGGYSDGTFRPENNATRGQISKIVSNAAGFNEPVSGQRFSDVFPGSTFYEFIERLAARNILGGYSDGTFRPGNNATRGQVSKIVANAFFPGCTTP